MLCRHLGFGLSTIFILVSTQANTIEDKCIETIKQNLLGFKFKESIGYYSQEETITYTKSNKSDRKSRRKHMLEGHNERKCFARQVKGDFCLALLLAHISSQVQSWKFEIFSMLNSRNYLGDMSGRQRQANLRNTTVLGSIIHGREI